MRRAQAVLIIFVLAGLSGCDFGAAEREELTASEYVTAHNEATDRLDRRIATSVAESGLDGWRAYVTTWSDANADAIVEISRLRPPARLETTHRLTIRCFRRSAIDARETLDEDEPILGAPGSPATMDLCDDARIANARASAGLPSSLSAKVDRRGYDRAVTRLSASRELRGLEKAIRDARDPEELVTVLGGAADRLDESGMALTQVVPPRRLRPDHREAIRCIRRVAQALRKLPELVFDAIEAGREPDAGGMISPRTARLCERTAERLDSAGVNTDFIRFGQ